MNRKLLILPLATILLSVAACSGGSSEVSSEVKDLIFNNSKFSNVIQLEIPRDENGSYQSFKEKYVDRTSRGLLLPVGVARSYGNLKAPWREFLTENDYVYTKSISLRQRNRSNEYIFLLYTKKLRDAVAKSEQSNRAYSGTELNIAKRELQSIDYENHYVQEMFGVEVETVAVTFSYRLDALLPELPVAESTFEGEARVFKDPDDGKWKIDKLALNDRGAYTYRELLEN